MAAGANSPQIAYPTALVNYLISMAKTAQNAVNRANQALLERSAEQARAVFLLEPRINEMELLINEHAIRRLRGVALSEETVRFIVATLKINNDLERMGDLAVNTAERVISLAEMEPAGRQNSSRWPERFRPWFRRASARSSTRTPDSPAKFWTAKPRCAATGTRFSSGWSR
jgi:phosphate uptake regulator